MAGNRHYTSGGCAQTNDQGRHAFFHRIVLLLRVGGPSLLSAHSGLDDTEIFFNWGQQRCIHFCGALRVIGHFYSSLYFGQKADKRPIAALVCHLCSGGIILGRVPNRMEQRSPSADNYTNRLPYR